MAGKFLQEGDTVRFAAFGGKAQGKVIEIRGDKVKVELGNGIPMTLDRSDVHIVSGR